MLLRESERTRRCPRSDSSLDWELKTVLYCIDSQAWQRRWANVVAGIGFQQSDAQITQHRCWIE